ncbi:MAG TPA: hypothetical protein PKV27_00180 [Ilumatobacteraceae bacterium]|nr:hypothetical protein [Ilumatobacteraceae bacterium]
MADLVGRQDRGHPTHAELHQACLDPEEQSRTDAAATPLADDGDAQDPGSLAGDPGDHGTNHVATSDGNDCGLVLIERVD